MVGDEASECRHMLDVTYPMDNGMVRSWEDMIHLWDYTFGPDRLNLDPPDCKVGFHQGQGVTNGPSKPCCGVVIL